MSGYLIKTTGAVLVLAALAAPPALEARSGRLQTPGNPYRLYRSTVYGSGARYHSPACRCTARSSYNYSYTAAPQQRTISSRYENRYSGVSYRSTRYIRPAPAGAIRPAGSAMSYGYQGRYSARERIVFYRNRRVSTGSRGAAIGRR